MMKTIVQIMDRAAGFGGSTIAVAAAHDEEVLQAVVTARKQKIAEPILIGDEARIIDLLRSIGESPEVYEIIPASDDADSAAQAVACIREGRAGFLMKGILSTGDLMRAVLNSETGIKAGNLISHVMVYESASYHKLLFLTDGGVNTFPDLEKKAGILENAAKVVRALGYGSINASCVCGAEAVDPKIQSTLDADALSGMKDRWEPYGMEVIGPVGLDMALSKEACRHKNYHGPGAGDADILLMPNYEMGNGIGKSLSFCGAGNAGIVVGARVPIVLVSRSDSAESKLASIALGTVIAHENSR